MAATQSPFTSLESHTHKLCFSFQLKRIGQNLTKWWWLKVQLVCLCMLTRKHGLFEQPLLCEEMEYFYSVCFAGFRKSNTIRKLEKINFERMTLHTYSHVPAHMWCMLHATSGLSAVRSLGLWLTIRSSWAWICNGRLCLFFFYLQQAPQAAPHYVIVCS